MKELCASLSAGVKEVLSAEKKGEEEADGAHNHICDTDKGVLTTHLTQSAQSETLAGIETVNLKVASYLKTQLFTLREVAIDLAVELAEGGQAGSTHPDDEMLVGHPFNGRDLVGIGLVQVLRGVVVGVVKAVQLAARGHAIVRVAIGARAQEVLAVGLVDGGGDTGNLNGLESSNL